MCVRFRATSPETYDILAGMSEAPELNVRPSQSDRIAVKLQSFLRSIDTLKASAVRMFK